MYVHAYVRMYVFHCLHRNCFYIKFRIPLKVPENMLSDLEFFGDFRPHIYGQALIVPKITWKATITKISFILFDKFLGDLSIMMSRFQYIKQCSIMEIAATLDQLQAGSLGQQNNSNENIRFRIKTATISDRKCELWVEEVFYFSFIKLTLTFSHRYLS